MTKYVSELSEKQKEELTYIFGNECVNFKKRERHYYTHDVGTLPYMVKPMLGKVEPAAIVKVSSEDEAVKLIKFSNKYKIPIVPRAGASSGYGGVIATKGGIIADVTSMNKIIEIDKESLTATVGAGIVWELLEYKLKLEGLSLRAVPSSAPSSTPGGWLAQAGVGYGSYEYGWSYETMESARIVLPTGEVKEITGADFDKISGTMGTTGIITQIKLKLRKYEETIATSAEFTDATSMRNAIKAVSDKKIPLWAITFLNPNFAEMKNKSPAATHHGHPVAKYRPTLPKAYVVNFAYPESRDVSALEGVIKAAGGKILPDEVAEHETEEWYKSMKVKRLGPSFIPAEVLVPLDNIDKVINEIDRKIKLPALMEGMITNDGMVALLCFIPHSELSVKFNLAFPLALSIVKIAENNGGRLYSSGLYFAQKADKVFGNKFAGIKAFKKQYDPKDIMNPEALTGKSLMNVGMSIAPVFEPISRFMGNMSGIKKKPAFKDPKGVIPDDTVAHAYTCAQCGYCVSECPQYYGRGWESQTSRGKWFFIKEYLAGREKIDQEQVNTFLACTTCETCVSKCQLDLPIEPAWMELRKVLVVDEKKMTFPPFEIMAASLIKERNIWATYQTDRDKWVPEDLKPKIKDKAEYGFFAGCTASLVEKDIAIAATRILDESGVEFTYMGNEEACCGIPMLASGKWDVFEGIMRLNVNNMQKRGVKTVVTTCPACWLVWNTIYREWAHKLNIGYDFKVQHYTEVAAEHLDVLGPKLQPLDKVITWHDSCHAGRAGGIYERPRDLIKAIPGVDFREMEYNRERSHCCGSVLSLINEPKVANKIGMVKLNEAMDVDADMLLALCPCCQVQLRVTADANNIPIDVQDIGSVVARSLGYDIADSTGVALESWALFEKMVYLLKPEAMTDLMVELLPQMMDAMPSYLKVMMKTVKYVPGMGALMTPIMPKMMPLLMPSLMPKVMPDMLKAVAKRVPMPDYMLEQMPDLMPKAMENLLPNMLPQIAPLLTPKMIEYIKNN